MNEESTMKRILERLSLDEKDILPYGREIVKILPQALEERERKGKLILTTAITPTKAGEGKTTTSIGLCDGLNALGKKAMACLREPSLGPVFGVKGGGTGGGKERLVPEDKINLHFTGDMHALTSVNNLIAAMVDNEIFQNSDLDIDPDQVLFPRAMDMNDRSLRHIETCLGKKEGPRHSSSFVITAACEPMAILCLAKDWEDFLSRMDDILVAKNRKGEDVFVRDLHIENAIGKLMEDALLPNLVSTSNGSPAMVHGGPFANIAHGTNSLLATKASLTLADYVVTEAGFGSDLGMEKYLDIVSPLQGFSPDLIVMVCSIRALKLHGGVLFEDLDKEDVESMQKGLANLLFHIRNAKQYGIDVLVSLNIFPNDSSREIEALEASLREREIVFARTTSYLDGPEGALDLAKKALALLEKGRKDFHPIVDDSMDVFEKIETIAKKVYGAKGVEYSDDVKAKLLSLTPEEKKFAVCMSKTPNSLSDDPHLLNVPEHVLHVKGLRLFHGARFLVPLTGSIVTMPGLPKVPLAKRMEK